MNWLYAKLAAVLSFFGLIFLLKREKENHAETSLKLEESEERITARLKAAKVWSDINRRRNERDKLRRENTTNNIEKLGDLEHEETDDYIVADELRGMYGSDEDQV